MKILIRQFLGQRHSWSVCGWGLAQATKTMGHEVHLFATDGIKHLPHALKENLIGYTELNQPKLYGRLPDPSYDCQISYTAMKNFPHMLSNGKKNRFGIWAWEFGKVIPNGFARHYQSCEMFCVPSQFNQQLFLAAGVPQNRITVIPHGINSQEYQGTSTIKLPTNKSFILLANLAVCHRRKNIDGMLEAYGKAFTNKDDVCLIIKAKDRPIKSPFDVSLNECLRTFNERFPRHAEVKVMSEFIEDMSVLYRSVSAVYTLSYGEGFNFICLEAMASGILSIAPKHGGQLDFLNDSNALLVNGKEVRADPKAMYWESKSGASWFQSDISDCVDKLRYAAANYRTMNATIDKQRSSVYNTYDWQKIMEQFLELCD